MLNYVRGERIRLDPSKNAEPVTYHDPCLFGRYYGITEEPRYLLAQSVADFREMYPNRLENWCCKGGGGLPTAYNSRRAEISKIKVDQILRTGAKVVATSCPNCIDGLGELVGEYNLDLKIKSVGEVVSQALIHH
jgi:Fe-S oxidoreductase